MANSDRRIKNEQGRMFIPMNIEGGGYDEKFLNTTKILALAGIGIGTVMFIMFMSAEELTMFGRVLFSLVYVIIVITVLRYVVFEERYFYKMYKKMQLYSNPTSDVFWNIASIKDTQRGGLLMFSDMKIGCVIKLERDSIIGRDLDFEEEHFDAISDFYRELMLRNLEFVQLNMMEQAGNDPRIPKLDDLAVNETNKNIKRMLEVEIGYLKNMTRATLYETDYILIYTRSIDRMDSLIDEIEDSAYKLLDGAYIGYDILNSLEVINLHKEIFGISYFDYSEAAINTFRNANIDNVPAIKPIALHLRNGSKIELTQRDILSLKRLSSYIENNDVSIKDLSILDTLEGIKFNNNIYSNNSWGVDVEKLASNLEDKTQENINRHKMSHNKITRANRNKNIPHVVTADDTEVHDDDEIDF